MYRVVSEGAARIRVPSVKVVTRNMPVFYNPVMKLNRDVSVLLLKCVQDSGIRVADPLAGSGVRGIRFLLELGRRKVDEVLLNDASKDAVANIKGNLRLNGISGRKAVVSNDDASLFLLKNRPFDYVDIDPFGSPAPFLDAAVKSVSRNGILAVTATDTAALSGTAPSACMRKYWAVPVRNFMMHELGLRILIRRVQLSAASVERALVPVYSYARQHYMRVFFRCVNKLVEVDRVLRQHRFVSFCSSCLNFSFGAAEKRCVVCRKSCVSVAGPLWTGSLFDGGLAS
ncbi:RsmD family RNA methyltransferase, partial [Candidatus Woesearchaeota archaeon]|nr:RsmD family RNA methyltransferase [Candidatus Woesearchaeota archaeon]